MLCAEENPEIRGRREHSPSQELERALILVCAHPTPALGGEPATDREKLAQISECVRGADWGLGLKSGSLDHLAGGGAGTEIFVLVTSSFSPPWACAVFF